jgi:hypothetical protein
MGHQVALPLHVAARENVRALRTRQERVPIAPPSYRNPSTYDHVLVSLRLNSLYSQPRLAPRRCKKHPTHLHAPSISTPIKRHCASHSAHRSRSPYTSSPIQPTPFSAAAACWAGAPQAEWAEPSRRPPAAARAPQPPLRPRAAGRCRPRRRPGSGPAARRPAPRPASRSRRRTAPASAPARPMWDNTVMGAVHAHTGVSTTARHSSGAAVRARRQSRGAGGTASRGPGRVRLCMCSVSRRRVRSWRGARAGARWAHHAAPLRAQAVH